ncbi:hypothetical protein AMTRI_Chr01g113120 [Amborella trichopoda]
MAAISMVVAIFFSIFGLIVFLLIFLICRPWRWCSTQANNDLKKPLISDDSDSLSDSAGFHASEEAVQHQLRAPSPPPTNAGVDQGGSVVLDISDRLEDLQVGQTIKHAVGKSWPVEEKFDEKKEPSLAGVIYKDGPYQFSLLKNYSVQRSSLSLEVISGPSSGIRFSVLSTNASALPFTLGRLQPCNLLLNDSGVSGKHAMINWDAKKMKWELVDMGSLNGTVLNTQAIHLQESNIRHWSHPFELSDGDIITLGSTSKVQVQIVKHEAHNCPFGVGVASDPMAVRRGAKKHPMEDVCYCQWPLPGVPQFGLFGIFDGHSGVKAAKDASEMLPKVVADILLIPERRQKVFSYCDASEVLKDAFSQTEAALTHQYEGCTASVLLVWVDPHYDFFAQCANVGDSSSVFSINGKQITVTEEHRLTSKSEITRLAKAGTAPVDGLTRLCGFNIARMLGDKFVKEQDTRFIAEPYVSQVVHIERASKTFAVMASDGLWDVLTTKRAVELIHKFRERKDGNEDDKAPGKIADFLLSQAKNLRTKDNTSIIFLDFDISEKASSETQTHIE